MEGIRDILVMVEVDLVLLFLLYIAVPLVDLAITLPIPHGTVPVCFQLGFEIAATVIRADMVFVQTSDPIISAKIIRLPFGDAVITSMKITFRH